MLQTTRRLLACSSVLALGMSCAECGTDEHLDAGSDAASGHDAATHDATPPRDAARNDAATGDATPVNHAPTASAGANQSVEKRELVTLDGTGSSDPDSDPLTYLWTQTAGISVTLDHTVAAQPTFTSPGNRSTLTFSLVVNDGELSSSADTVDVIVGNTAPVASAGSGTTVHQSEAVMLDGSASYDPDSDPLTYRWTQTAGVSVTLDHAVPRRPTFTTPATPTTLTFSLVVNDGDVDSSPATVTVQVVNGAPVANSGDWQIVPKHTLVTLDGTGSTDPDGDPLTFRWVQRSGISVTLDHTDVAQPTFTAPDQPGELHFWLYVHDGYQESAQSSVQITVVDRTPVAAAGADQQAQPFDVVTLDGSASSDPDDDNLSYLWLQTAGATVTLNHTDPAHPTFVAPNDSGVLIFELTVNDGRNTSVADNVRVVIDNHAPIADAGVDQNAARGALVILDGSGSYDPDDDPLTYAWTQLSGPQVWLDDATVSAPTFHAPTRAAGTSVLSLVVNDGVVDSSPSTVQIALPNQAPSASISSPADGYNGGELALLDASASSDPDNDRLSYRWEQIGGTPVEIGNGDEPLLRFSVPSANENVTFRVVVGDGAASATAEHTISAIAYAGPTKEIPANPFAGRSYNPASSETYDSNAFDRSGNLMAVAGWGATTSSPDLYILDISTPRAPQVLASAQFPGGTAPEWISFDGTLVALGYVSPAEVLIYEYVAASGQLLFRSTLTFGAAPTQVREVAVAQGFLFVSLRVDEETGELRIFDVDDPAAPALATSAIRSGGWFLGNFAKGVAVVGSYAYWLDGGLLIYDISALTETTPTIMLVNPTSIIQAGQALTVVGNIAYLANGNGGIVTVDVTNPTQPVELSRLSLTGTAYDVRAVGNRAFVATYTSGIQLVDVSNPRAMQLIETYGTTRSWIETLEVSADGSTVYTQLRDNGIEYFSGGTDPAAFVASFPTTRDCESVTLDEDRLFVSDGYLIHALDVSDPTAISALGQVAASGKGGMAVSAGMLFAAGGVGWSGLSVIDINELATPVLQGQIYETEVIDSLVLAVPYAFVTRRDSSVRAVKVVAPSQPFEVARAATPMQSVTLWWQGDYLYAGSHYRIDVIGAADPASHFAAVSTASVAKAKRFMVSGRYLWGVRQRLDVSDPLQPGTAQNTSGPIGMATDLRMSGPIAYQAMQGGELYLVDYSAPTAARVLARYRLPAEPTQVALGSHHAFVADGAAGMQVVARDGLVLDQRRVTATRSTALAYQVAWPATDLDLRVACLVTGGTCAVSNLDQDADSATVTWTLPGSAGDHELVVQAGNGSFFVATWDRVAVQ